MKWILQILGSVLEWFLKERKKQVKVKPIGRDSDLDDDMKKTLEDQIIKAKPKKDPSIRDRDAIDKEVDGDE